MQTKSGKALHPIGIGTWLVGGDFEFNTDKPYNGSLAAPEKDEADIDGIRYSLSKGQNHIDCAEMYGAFHTDEVIGRAIADTPREDLYIADKLWKTSLGAGLVRSTVEQMLEKLSTDYLDLLYIHFPFPDAPWHVAIPQIDALIDEGVVRQFGVSNFTLQDMKQAADITKHGISANQMRYSILNHAEVDQEFSDYCAANSIALVAYQPLTKQTVLQNETIRNIADTHNATPTQVALAWLLAKGALPIPKATQPSHIDDNLKALDLELTAEELITLDRL